jgi:hypothetical protein
MSEDSYSLNIHRLRLERFSRIAIAGASITDDIRSVTAQPREAPTGCW